MTTRLTRLNLFASCRTAPTSCSCMTSVSGPLKAAWRLILTEYKSYNQLQAGILKTDFPCLLVKLCTDKSCTVPAYRVQSLQQVSCQYRQGPLERISHRPMESLVQPGSSSIQLWARLWTCSMVQTSTKRGTRKIQTPSGKSNTAMLEDQKQ